MDSRVQIHIYDLSRGLARWSSQLILGQQIHGLWHTEIAVFGMQLSFGPHRGIEDANSRKPWELRPRHILDLPFLNGSVGTIDMGFTMVTRAEFEGHLEEMMTRYQDYNYHSLDFNCNTFTNECVQFLVGHGLPAWLIGQPQLIPRTPRGALLCSVVRAYYRRPLRVLIDFLRVYLTGRSLAVFVPRLISLPPALLIASKRASGIADATDVVNIPPPITYLSGWDEVHYAFR